MNNEKIEDIIIYDIIINNKRNFSRIVMIIEDFSINKENLKYRCHQYIHLIS